jgi:hypothetical protein
MDLWVVFGRLLGAITQIGWEKNKGLRRRAIMNEEMPGNFYTALWRSIVVTLRTVWRVTRQLFHETTGALFGLFAVWAAFAAWKQWRNRPTLWILAFAVAYAIMMAVFAFVSFRRARRVR